MRCFLLKLDHEENQAEKLSQLFAEVVNQSEEDKANETKESTDDFIEVDVLNLPPRSEVHKTPKRKLYIHLGSPFTRLLSVLFILVIIIGIIYFIAGEQILLFFS